MVGDIDWVEYERRKAKIQNIGLTSEDLDSESDDEASA
jgi:hypothetical protein